MGASGKESGSSGSGLRVTLAVLAREAGVSTTTVSLALNGKGRSVGLSETTIDRIQKTAERLNYLPNESARGLRRGRTGLVAALFPHLRNDWADRIVAGIEESLAAEDFSLVILNHREDVERERRAMQSLLQGRVDGILCNPQAENAGLYREVIGRGMPLVFFSDALKGLPEVGYSAWDPGDVHLALEHLAERGYRRVGLLGVRDRRVVARARWTAFAEGVARCGLRRSARWSLSMARGSEVLPELERRLDAGRALPDALFSLYDELAFGAMDLFASRGIRVPEDVAVITLGDSPLAGRYGYDLTTVAAPVEEEGRAAGRILVERLTHPKAACRHTLVKGGRLMVRGSTG
ncbi:MAG: LacI family DNA-binding transcriptional regulator [Kiritimatiellae bacterium]|nr:LacI family DNA-binding transcriptional regulator [Kiritimatiellia bacterium]